MEKVEIKRNANRNPNEHFETPCSLASHCVVSEEVEGEGNKVKSNEEYQ